MILVAVRYLPTTWNLAGRLQGHADPHIAPLQQCGDMRNTNRVTLPENRILQFDFPQQ
jgi:hypothetical protein